MRHAMHFTPDLSFWCIVCVMSQNSSPFRLSFDVKTSTMNEQHWNSIYQTKPDASVSWYEAYPKRSIDTINAFKLPKTARIVDVGGGDSRLVDALLQHGYQHITVLDVAEEALMRAKSRLGSQAQLVDWVVADVTTYQPPQVFDVWHDRAVFHFMTTEAQVDDYIRTARRSVIAGGFMTVGTFSEQGPTGCSGLPIRQYSQMTLSQQFSQEFQKLACSNADHITPAGVVQAFTFCQFQRKG